MLSRVSCNVANVALGIKDYRLLAGLSNSLARRFLRFIFSIRPVGIITDNLVELRLIVTNQAGAIDATSSMSQWPDWPPSRKSMEVSTFGQKLKGAINQVREPMRHTCLECQWTSADSMAAWISSRAVNFCVMSRPCECARSWAQNLRRGISTRHSSRKCLSKVKQRRVGPTI